MTDVEDNATKNRLLATPFGSPPLRSGSPLSVANNLFFVALSLTSVIRLISLPSSLIDGKELSHLFWHRG